MKEKVVVLILFTLVLNNVLCIPLQHEIEAVREARESDDDVAEVSDEGNDEEEEDVKEEDNNEPDTAAPGSGSKRNVIEDSKDSEESENDVEADNEDDDIDKPDELDNKDTEEENNNEAEKSKVVERPSEIEAPVKQDEQASKKEEVPYPEVAKYKEDDETTVEDVNEAEEGEASNRRSSVVAKRWGSEGHHHEDEGHHEDEEDDHHHHGHHEHEHEHHHHGHHHGFVHEWGEEEGGEHHGHEGHGHHEHEHEHEHEHGHGHEHMGHEGYGGGYGGGGGGGEGGGGGWGRSRVYVPAPPMAFHCRDMISTDGKQHTRRFCVPIGHNGGYGWPYFHGYPGTGLGLWGWGHPWIKSKLHRPKKTIKEQRDKISKKQTVHVGYGYASGDNYRLGYQAGGMGGLASQFSGQIGAGQENHFKKSMIDKRQFAGPSAMGNSGVGGHSTPYGHPVTHPGFTTMGFPGHALASTDVRNQIRHPNKVRRAVYDDDEDVYPEASYFQDMNSNEETEPQLIEETPDIIAPYTLA